MARAEPTTVDGATVAAYDIARLAGVGRAAVSNWRRRYPDFPKPVSGSASSPLYSLTEVETWLTRHGKAFEVMPGDRVWQRIRGEVDDLDLGDLIGYVGAFLVFMRRQPGRWKTLAAKPDRGLAGELTRAVVAAVPELPDALASSVAAWVGIIRLVAETAAEHGDEDLFDLLCDRYLEAHSRRLPVTPAPIAELMVELIGPGPARVLDPACGIGSLLLAVPPSPSLPLVLYGQEANGTAARLAAVRLLLKGRAGRFAAGDSLRHDAFAGERVDAVVCNPPFNERSWGYDELTADQRWEYGLPPRGEPELAWVQHCLSHVNPGGHVVIMMPAGVASRRSGKRIRGNLLRAGALRAIIGLSSAGPAGVIAPDLWILRRPGPDSRPPSTVLMVDASTDLAVVVPAWHSFQSNPDSDPPGPSRSVRIIDLLDEDVDLSPPRYVSRAGQPGDSGGYRPALDALRAASAALAEAPPELAPAAAGEPGAMTTVGELIRAGAVVVHQAPLKMTVDGGDHPTLTIKDVRVGRAPSGWGSPDPGSVVLEPGDVVTPIASREPVVRVVVDGGALLGPQLLLFRPDHSRIDPYFLAGFLRAAQAAPSRVSSLSARTDVHRAPIPRLPLAEQRAYGTAFAQLIALEEQAQAIAVSAERLVRLGFAGLADGSLLPPAATE